MILVLRKTGFIFDRYKYYVSVPIVADFTFVFVILVDTPTYKIIWNKYCPVNKFNIITTLDARRMWHILIGYCNISALFVVNTFIDPVRSAASSSEWYYTEMRFSVYYIIPRNRTASWYRTLRVAYRTRFYATTLWRAQCRGSSVSRTS